MHNLMKDISRRRQSATWEYGHTSTNVLIIHLQTSLKYTTSTDLLKKKKQSKIWNLISYLCLHPVLIKYKLLVKAVERSGLKKPPRGFLAPFTRAIFPLSPNNLSSVMTNLNILYCYFCLACCFVVVEKNKRKQTRMQIDIRSN